MPKKVIAEKEITVPEVKRLLESIEELNLFQLRTLEYVNRFSKLDERSAEELVNRLVERYNIDQEDAVQIVNSMPTSIEELRVFFAASRRKIILTSRLEEILRLLDEYR